MAQLFANEGAYVFIAGRFADWLAVAAAYSNLSHLPNWL